MSATVSFNTENGAAAAAASKASPASGSVSKAVVILPSQLLVQLIGRRVTVLLSHRNEELEGVLRSVDDDRGDVFLDEVVHYAWRPTEEDAGTDSAHPAVDGDSAVDGGGVRRELRRHASAMVSSRFIELITPTVFKPVAH